MTPSQSRALASYRFWVAHLAEVRRTGNLEQVQSTEVEVMNAERAMARLVKWRIGDTDLSAMARVYGSYK